MFGIDDILIIIGLIIVGMVGSAHWKEIKDILLDTVQTTVEFCETVLCGAWHAAKVFLQCTRDGMIRIVHRLYYAEKGKIKERTHWVERTISVSELPKDVQEAFKKAQGRGELDVTREMERVLDLKLS